ncbi:hypothetical protein OG381_47205 [Streptomyces sp. NBC_00490]|uniref:nucleic acid/nucleotide deaminase domain-containing protein n=1 Tax=Streptomyces sp. NBC_00490 TaxID=2903657 RepID=UPI002E1890F1
MPRASRFTGNWGWNNNCHKEDRDTATKPPAVQAVKHLSDKVTNGAIEVTGQASLGFLDGLTFGTFSYASGGQITCPTAYNSALYATMVPFPLEWDAWAAKTAIANPRHGQIAYGEGRLSQAVQLQRLIDKKKTGNYAAALLKSGEVIVASANKDFHAEEKLLNQAGKDIVAIYSERQPCNGTHNCAGKILTAGIKYVSWSFPWSTDKASVGSPPVGRRDQR